ncbi:MAG TPA: AMP-binding protein [Stellaceae bacterium]|jgi:feruloyl-CoA synthase
MNDASPLPPFRAVEALPPAVDVERRADGTIILRCPYPLGDYPANIVAHLRRWAEEAPDRAFLAERGPERSWRTVDYATMRRQADAIGQALLDRGLGPDRALMILSANSLAHAAMSLAALTVGVPVAPVSTAYSLVSRDFAKLKFVYELVRPGMIFVENGAQFSRALDALDLAGVEIVAADGGPAGRAATRFADLVATAPTPAVEAAYDAVTPDTLAKILFTSGSTGQPKGVINPQRMLCANQAMSAALRPQGAAETPPVALDWMPWNHTMAGNAAFNRLMRLGGTLYIDDGRPLPGEYDKTIANLREIRPTAFSTAPAAFAMLADALERDDGLGAAFFSRLTGLGYGGASLPDEVFQRFQQLAIKHTGLRIPFLCGWGSTETAPAATQLWWAIDGSGNIGLPIPGCEIKMVPAAEGRYELRVRGPHITPGYLNRPDLTEVTFDEERFYRIGDTARFVDPADPKQGLQFTGRATEDFKLLTATWVATGPLRLAVLDAASPLLRDCVITGHDRDFVGLLAWPNLARCQELAGDRTLSFADVARAPKIVAALRDALKRHNAGNHGSSTRIARAILMAEPPSIEANEITDKGYVNQAATLARRAALVEKLYAASPGGDVIVVQ